MEFYTLKCCGYIWAAITLLFRSAALQTDDTDGITLFYPPQFCQLVPRSSGPSGVVLPLAATGASYLEL